MIIVHRPIQIIMYISIYTYQYSADIYILGRCLEITFINFN